MSESTLLITLRTLVAFQPGPLAGELVPAVARPFIDQSALGRARRYIEFGWQVRGETLCIEGRVEPRRRLVEVI